MHPVDTVLLEGDLNYYTAYGDLLRIEELSRRQNILFPIVFFARSMLAVFEERYVL